MTEDPTHSIGRDDTASIRGDGARGQGHAQHEIGEKPGDTIGPYRLLEIIGVGGFGVVFLAERREPMVQRVALKIIKPGMDSRVVIGSFEQERQALAVMDHPNVARVFDGGVTASGRPYFVMEYVRGEPITSFCDRHRYTIRQRLELFIPVCEAVQHAHHKGIIHRDIKPSNVLVAEVDGSPVVKVIDFGVAKAIAHDDWDFSAFTEQGAIIGTPAYMSPEQVTGQADVDTRSDVYSLGVLLYELLTGDLPFDSRLLLAAGLGEIQRIIRDQTPPKPSTKLSALAGAHTTVVAGARATSRERLSAELRRELDWIPMMALRKERERRYASAAALAEDLRRYLDGRALLAAPDSRAYLARKFVRRNRVSVIATTAVAAALVTGFGVALWQAREAAIQRNVAVTQSARANERAAAAEKAQAAEKERADQLKKVSDFQEKMLGQIDPTTAGVRLTEDVVRRYEVSLEKAGVPELERAAQTESFRQAWLKNVNATDTALTLIDTTILTPAVKAIDEQFKDQPLVDAQLRQVLADRYESIGLFDAALPLQMRALATRRRVLGEEHPQTLTSIANTGTLLHDLGRFPEAASYLQHGVDLCRRILGEEDENTVDSISNLGVLLQQQGNLSAATPLLREALEKRRRLFGEDHPDTLSSINNWGMLLQLEGNLPEAEEYLREALEKRRRVLGEEHPSTLVSISNVGFVLQEQGKVAEAESFVYDALVKRRHVFGEDHPDTLDSVHNMGVLLYQQDKFTDAERYLREALGKRRRVLGEENPVTITSIATLAGLLYHQGKLREAEPYYREALEKRRRVLGDKHSDTLTSLLNMGGVLEEQGMLAEAEPFYREALRIRRAALPDGQLDFATSLNNFAQLLEAQNKLEDADLFFREALAIDREALPAEDPGIALASHNLALLLQHRNKLDESEPLFREAMEINRAALTEGHPNTLISTTSLGALLILRGKCQEAIDLLAPEELAARKAFTGGIARRLAYFLAALGRARVGLGYDAERFTLAEANLLEAYPIFVAAKDRGPTHKDTLECAQGLVDLYTAWDKAEPGKGYYAKAAEWKAKLEAGEPEASNPATEPAATAAPK